MTDHEMDTIDTSLAQTSAALLKAVLQAARIRNAEDAETTGIIDTLTACRLIVTAEGPKIQIELLAPVDGGTLRLYGGTFEEAVLQ